MPRDGKGKTKDVIASARRAWPNLSAAIDVVRAMLSLRCAAGVVVVLTVAGCAPKAPAPTSPDAPTVVASPPGGVASGPPHGTAAPPKPDPCPPPSPGSVSDDDAPVLAGVGELTELVPWLESRGVSRASAITWFARHFGDDVGHAEAIVDPLSCSPLTVGNAAEEALACETPETYTWMRIHALVLVVRKKRIVPVLDVGLGMRALDWPDSRHLDLTLAFEPGGKVATLRERAAEGAILVPPPSACRRHHALVEACDQALAKGVEPPERCPFTSDSSGQRRLIPWSEIRRSPFGDGSATLHGCDWARAELKRAVDDAKTTPIAKDARGALAFIQRACNGLGRYVWKGDRFVFERTSTPAQGSASSL
jgi:hypothetical protein